MSMRSPDDRHNTEERCDGQRRKDAEAEVERSVSWRCPVCGLDTSDPEHRAWACEAALS